MPRRSPSPQPVRRALCRLPAAPRRGGTARWAALLLACCLVWAALGAPATWAADPRGGGRAADLLRQLEQGDVEARRHALLDLADVGDDGAVPKVAAALRDGDVVVRKLAEQALWSIWSHSGDEGVDQLLQAGSLLLAQGQAGQSVVIFTRVIERAPQFAEGYNKRATAYYQIGEYEKSLQDIDEVLKLNPYHFGALSGAGLCLIELERYSQAIGYFDRALKINPNLDGIIQLRRAVEKRNKKPLI
jgi:tetratricopeptide (TPR) repeat protein